MLEEPRVPAEFERLYLERGYWRDVLLDEFVLRHSATDPDRVAVVDGERRLTYRQLAEGVDRAAAALASVGLEPGDRVVVQLPNVAEFLTTVLGLVRHGVRPVLTPPALGERELRHVLASTEARGAVLADQLTGRSRAVFERVRAERPDLLGVFLVPRRGRRAPEGTYDLAALLDGEHPEVPGGTGDGAHDGAHDSAQDSADVALYLLSGGSTGMPKAIPRTHRDYVHNIEISCALAALGPDSRYLAALPVTHNFALGCPGVLGTLAVGGTVVLGEATPRALARSVSAERITVTALVPGLAGSLADATEDLSSLDVLQVGGAKLYEADARKLQENLPGRIQQVFGMAEGLLNFTRLDDPDDVVARTQGRPASEGDEWRIVDQRGREVPPGESGELQVRGPYTIRGYLAPPEVNAASFTEDGHYRTGDVVRLDPSGNLVVVGRRTEFINRAGEKIAAADIEALLAGHPGVAQCVAVAAPHEFLGETVCLFAVPRDHQDLSLHELRDYLRARGLAPYGLPERLRLMDRLPLTAVGKFDRAELARMAEAR
ncbi:AMP-binding protein [Streptomyces sp. NPDC005438]|uniref:(2,3-dihydroxybenzoyl)adenylate synthase n=1 Tax=Streptomyces sp. NPDC005438 TaxID=3156880 RepID=UPI0033A841F9